MLERSNLLSSTEAAAGLQRWTGMSEGSYRQLCMTQYRQLRRSKSKHQAELYGTKEDHSASFFDTSNPEGAKKREMLATECMEQLITWLKKGGNVGIHGKIKSRPTTDAKMRHIDATNSTRSRR